MTDAVFLDCSEWQARADFVALKRSGVDAVGCRVAYGARPDNAMPARRDAIRAQNFSAVLWYLFLRPSQLLQDQVNTVTGVLPFMRPGECLFIDWESDYGALASPAQVQALAMMFEHVYRQPTGIYASPSNIARIRPPGPVWVAAYGQAEPTVPHTLWQYTDGKYTSGCYGPVNFAGIGVCDASVFHGTWAQLAAAISPLPDPAPLVPIGQPEEDEDMCARTITYPDGSKTVATLDGGVENYGTPFFGSVPGLKPESRKSFTQVGALTAVDPANPAAGYVVWNVTGDKYTFNAATLAAIDAGQL